MTDRQRHGMSKPGSSGPGAGVKDARQLRALLPPLTPGLIFRAFLGMLLFFFGTVLAAWLIFRFRRHSQDSNVLGE
ncbi:MAG: hypothetical protein J2P27_08325 [Actinobacteria bacterium]|nr:hypothetical protein [Actinomycetota bacterium]